jgi:hypothetical protein
MLHPVTVSQIHGWFVALHHRTNRGEHARHTEPVGLWLRRNAELLSQGGCNDWIAVGIAPTSGEASHLLDTFEGDMER